MNDDWFDLLAALDDAKARFLIVGAHALAGHGIPRGTQDLDVWVDPTEENVVLSNQSAMGPFRFLGGNRSLRTNAPQVGAKISQISKLWAKFQNNRVSRAVREHRAYNFRLAING